MSDKDFDNMVNILHQYIVKYKHETQVDLTLSQEEKDWMVKHADYVQHNILDKVINGIQKYESDN